MKAADRLSFCFIGVIRVYRGETITTEIRDLPIPVSEIQSLYVVFHTFTKTLLEKTLDDCKIDGEVIECRITQEESLKFSCGPISRTIIVITKDGSRFEKSNQEMVVGQTAKSEVLT